MTRWRAARAASPARWRRRNRNDRDGLFHHDQGCRDRPPQRADGGRRALRAGRNAGRLLLCRLHPCGDDGNARRPRGLRHRLQPDRGYHRGSRRDRGDRGRRGRQGHRPADPPCGCQQRRARRAPPPYGGAGRLRPLRHRIDRAGGARHAVRALVGADLERGRDRRGGPSAERRAAAAQDDARRARRRLLCAGKGARRRA